MDFEKILINISCFLIKDKYKRKKKRRDLVRTLEENRIKRGYKTKTGLFVENFLIKFNKNYLLKYKESHDIQRRILSGERDPVFYKNIEEAPLSPRKRTIKSVAFYLPQMHAIPENDAWWGKGFTEWRNVARGMPSYVGHYQPRCPGELGYYDLSNIEVMERQVELAKLYGLDAFCFYYYWFEGKRLLEKPLNAFLEAKHLDHEFCICWANENWTRTWDGHEHQVLIGQNHSAADSAAVFEDWLPYFRDERYIRIDDCPLLVIYRPTLIPGFAEMASMWREMAKKAGLKGLHIISSYAKRNKDAEKSLDAYYEFPPQNLYLPEKNHHYRWLEGHVESKLYLYADALAEAKKIHEEEVTPIPLYPGAMPGWDNEARRPRRGHIFEGASPLLFQEWLQSAYARADRNPQERLVFINAWNEWGEGAYLEPDLRYGYANLAALRSVVEEHSEQ